MLYKQFVIIELVKLVKYIFLSILSRNFSLSLYFSLSLLMFVLVSPIVVHSSKLQIFQTNGVVQLGWALPSQPHLYSANH